MRNGYWVAISGMCIVIPCFVVAPSCQWTLGHNEFEPLMCQMHDTALDDQIMFAVKIAI